MAKGCDTSLRPQGVYDTWKYEIAVIGSADAPTRLRLTEFGNVDDFLPVGPGEVADPDGVVGQYRSETTGAEVTIVSAANGLRATTSCEFGSATRELECLAGGIWRLKAPDLNAPSGGVLSFDTKAAFRFSSICNRSILFRRCV
jgi:hypothetical protein